MLREVTQRRSGKPRDLCNVVDTAKLSTTERLRRRLCAQDSTYTRVEPRYDGALRVAYDMPCDASKLANSPALPPAGKAARPFSGSAADDGVYGTIW